MTGAPSSVSHSLSSTRSTVCPSCRATLTDAHAPTGPDPLDYRFNVYLQFKAVPVRAAVANPGKCVAKGLPGQLHLSACVLQLDDSVTIELGDGLQADGSPL